MSDFQYRKVGITHLSSHHYELIPYGQTQETATLVHNTLNEMYANAIYIDKDIM